MRVVWKFPISLGAITSLQLPPDRASGQHRPLCVYTAALVERLSIHANSWRRPDAGNARDIAAEAGIADEAAEALTTLSTENERLRKQVEAMTEGLRPFAAYADHAEAHHPGWAHDGFAITGFDDLWKYSDFARARTLIAESENSHG